MLQHFQINFPFFTRSLCSVYLRIKLTILLCTQTHTENDVIFWLGNICTYKMAFLISGFLSCIALSSVWKLSWHLRKNAQCQVIWFWYAIDRPRHVSTSESDLFFIIDQSVSQSVSWYAIRIVESMEWSHAEGLIWVFKSRLTQMTSFHIKKQTVHSPGRSTLFYTYTYFFAFFLRSMSKDKAKKTEKRIKQKTQGKTERESHQASCSFIK